MTIRRMTRCLSCDKKHWTTNRHSTQDCIKHLDPRLIQLEQSLGELQAIIPTLIRKDKD